MTGFLASTLAMPLSGAARGSKPVIGAGRCWRPLRRAEHDLGALARHARSLSPQHVVERGFAVVRRVDGTVVRGPDEVAPGDLVEVTVARGVIAARVETRRRSLGNS